MRGLGWVTWGGRYVWEVRLLLVLLLGLTRLGLGHFMGDSVLSLWARPLRIANDKTYP